MREPVTIIDFEEERHRTSVRETTAAILRPTVGDVAAIANRAT